MSRKRNIRLLIAFDGGGYGGWQRQKNCLTIQEVLEKSLGIITNEPITVTGAGRTDAGVHAEGMNANFHTSSSIPLPGLLKGLNSMLPPDIRLLDVVDTDPDFHSRFNARGKTYRYDFFNGPIQAPHERFYRVHVPKVSRLEPINECLELLLGTHDFSSFEACGSRDKNITTGKGAVRTLFEARLEQIGPTPAHFSFFFTGDGFLRHMVRNMVGTLFEVGKSKLDSRQFAEIMAARDRNLAGPTAPALGLFLVKVYYDNEEGQ